MYKIQTITAGSAVASLDFTVPSGYDDLMIVTSLRSAQADVALEVFIAFNGSTSSFSARQLYGTGSSAASSTPARQVGLLPGANATASTFNSGTIYIPNYLGSTNKSYSVDSVTENNGTIAYQNIVAGLWSVTDPITSISLTTTGGNNFVQGSTATLYGIKKLVIPPAKATGGVATYSAGYWYHAFTGSGTFAPTESLTADILVVAGGGGGGYGADGAWAGGGGGGGGLQYFASQSLTAQNYTVTVGSGGSSDTTGTLSQFAALSSSTGGGGGANLYNVGKNGGSGGGGTLNVAAGTGISGQGNNGAGGGGTSGTPRGGGGGGASAAGGGTNGGAGSSSYSAFAIATNTGSSFAYAGGGGGAINENVAFPNNGGIGGGGSGSNRSGNAVAGTANSGGGGGGGVNYNGANGGSGVVIVRYAA